MITAKADEEKSSACLLPKNSSQATTEQPSQKKFNEPGLGTKSGPITDGPHVELNVTHALGSAGGGLSSRPSVAKHGIQTGSARRKKQIDDRFGETCKTLTLSDGPESQIAGSPKAHFNPPSPFLGQRGVSPPKLFRMPLKTEVIKLVKGPSKGVVGCKSLSPIQITKEKTPDLYADFAGTTSSSPTAGQPRQALRQTMFQVPIAPKKIAAPQPQALESIFGAGKRQPKNISTYAAQQWRAYSPNSLEQPDLNLTTAQLFKVYAEKVTPQEIVDRQQIDKPNDDIQLQSAATFGGDETLDKTSIEKGGLKKKPTTIDVLINVQNQNQRSSYDKHATLRVDRISPDKITNNTVMGNQESFVMIGSQPAQIPKLDSFSVAADDAASPSAGYPARKNYTKMHSQHSLSIVSSSAREPGSPLKAERFNPIYYQQNQIRQKPSTSSGSKYGGQRQGSRQPQARQPRPKDYINTTNFHANEAQDLNSPATLREASPRNNVHSPENEQIEKDRSAPRHGPATEGLTEINIMQQDRRQTDTNIVAALVSDNWDSSVDSLNRPRLGSVHVQNSQEQNEKNKLGDKTTSHFMTKKVAPSQIQSLQTSYEQIIDIRSSQKDLKQLPNTGRGETRDSQEVIIQYSRAQDVLNSTIKQTNSTTGKDLNSSLEESSLTPQTGPNIQRYNWQQGSCDLKNVNLVSVQNQNAKEGSTNTKHHNSNTSKNPIAAASDQAYLQVSPRDFNQQIIKEQTHFNAENKMLKGQKRVGYGPAASTRTQSKREHLQKMAGVHGGKNQYAAKLQQQTDTNYSNALIIDNTLLKKKALIQANQTTHSVIAPNLSIIKEQSQCRDLEISLDREQESYDGGIMSGGQSRGHSPCTKSYMDSTTIPPRRFDSKQVDTEQASQQRIISRDDSMNKDQFNNLVRDVHEKQQSPLFNGNISQQEHSMMSNEGMISELIEIQQRELELFNSINDKSINESIRKQEINLSIGEKNMSVQLNNIMHELGAATKNQPVWSKIEPYNPNHRSISIQQSDQIDGESSYQTARLTPMELKLPNSKNQLVSMNTSKVGKDARKNKHKLKLGSTLIKKTTMLKPFELIKSTSGKISVQISHSRSPDRKKSNSSEQKQKNNQEGSILTMQQAPKKIQPQNTSPKNVITETDLKKKAFLRQVYTNMQNKMVSKNSHYEKYSKKYKKELDNPYAKRQKIDNEWQMRVMNSKLQVFDESKDIGKVPSSLQNFQAFNLASADNMIQTARMTNNQRVHSPFELSASQSQRDQNKEDLVALDLNSNNNSTNLMSDKNAVIVDSMSGSLFDEQNKIQTSQNEHINSIVSFSPRQKHSVDKSAPFESKANFESRMKQNQDHQQQAIEQKIQMVNPGSNAYLDHVRQRMNIKSQGHGVRNKRRRLITTTEHIIPSQKDSQRKNNAMMIQQNVQMISAAQGSNFPGANRAHLKTSGQSRREVLRLDFAVGQDKQQMSSLYNKSTKNASAQSKAVFSQPGLHTTREQRLISPMSSNNNKDNKGPKTLTSQMIFPVFSQTRKNSVVNNVEKTRQNFATNQAKPSLFKPMQMETVKVDSYVQACKVATQFTKPGKPYQTTQSLVQLNFNLENQQGKGSRMQRNREQYQLESQFSTAGDEEGPLDPNNACTNGFAKPYRTALNLNRQVSEQNRALRRKAFSFTKSVNKKDICQIAKNCDDLNKPTRNQFSLKAGASQLKIQQQQF